MEDHSSLSGSPSLVFIQDTSRRIITNFDKSLENICHVQNDVLNLGHVLERLMSELETEYKRLLMVNILLGAQELFENFLKCCRVPSRDFRDLLNVPEPRFAYCLKGTFPSNPSRTKRAGISLASYLMGEGESISTVASSLSATITQYNENYEKVADLDTSLVASYNLLMSKVEDFSAKERLFREIIIEMQLKFQLLQRRQVFMRIKSQHFSAISALLHRSSFHENLDLLERALFHRNICSLLMC